MLQTLGAQHPSDTLPGEQASSQAPDSLCRWYQGLSLNFYGSPLKSP